MMDPDIIKNWYRVYCRRSCGWDLVLGGVAMLVGVAGRGVYDRWVWLVGKSGIGTKRERKSRKA
jgi:hypothetical protein